ncbi:MAG: imidazole glycerol phosphate synthase subunit HisF [Chloroflexota bacterium]|nr:imidazole glycerol phosphate synthase subunit HisF [Chloroflexota bacterium]MDE2936690.1 imidazole glycerol phosphate synthase subunit HisF [Chloroflexota bacterium]MXW27683.1 imidazole glycerol phosphate synthase subunit HisF [Chloroflexota bacterium]MXY12729.1 imidazole glycerol phosphate synthase subunit HisF [Chloroflexota bacterium]MYC47995.1 imidazole glycerol phosphate synthase subunit HisF [Chloroflexota bacterium]
MLTRRIIPCLDVKNGRNVRGVRFSADRDAGDPVELASYYDQTGADELVFYDISASAEGRDITLGMMRAVAEQVFIPLTAGGGVRSTADMYELLRAGADKVSVNTAAVERERLVSEGADRFGSQCIVLSIDSRRKAGGGWEVWTHGGRTNTGIDTLEWAERGVELGAGEIVLNSIDADGTRDGYDNEQLAKLTRRVPVPVVASGGAGTLEHLHEALATGGAHAVLAASIFHYKVFTIAQAKEYLAERGNPMRIDHAPAN